ncbi:hypothetical protein HY641_01765 [Candidatus Woesearchaeota archaeon]|nr:hypothetical protein [Candidatus Woesearchaeota archaeon]
MKKIALIIGLLVVLSSAVHARGAVRDVVVKTTMTEAMKARIATMQAFEAQRQLQGARVRGQTPKVPARTQLAKGLFVGIVGPKTSGPIIIGGKVGGGKTSFNSKYERTLAFDQKLRSR